MDPITLFIIYILGSVFALAIIFNGAFYGAMYMAIPKKKLKKIIQLGHLNEKMTVYDLGAGYGRIMFEAAKSGATVVGYEVEWGKAYWIRHQIQKKMLWNATIIHDDLKNACLGLADIVYCYLSPPLMKGLAEKAKKEMKLGARIISVEHQIPNWTPSYADTTEKIYVYTV